MTFKQDALDDRQSRSNRIERRRLEGLWWALVLIWAGFVFGADSLGLLPQIGVGDAWSWVFAGAGILGILGSFYRFVSAEVPNPKSWDWVWGGFCLIIGLGGFTRLEISWPLILLLLGTALLVSALWRRGQAPIG